MKAKMGFGLVAVAGFAASALAIDVPHRTLVPGKATITGNVFVNQSTGDRIVLPGSVRQGTESQFNNNNFGCNTGGAGFNFTPMAANGIYDFVNGFDGEVGSYGDAPAGTEYNCYVWLYAVTDVADTGAGAIGFDTLATFYDNDNSTSAGGPDLDVDPSAAFLVTDSPGDLTPGDLVDLYDGWLFTVDVSAGGTQTFLAGDTDEDGDGLADIGWGYSWGGPALSPPALATADFGPGAAVPGNVSGLPSAGTGDPLPNAQGTEDDLTAYLSTWFTEDPFGAAGNNDGLIDAAELRGGVDGLGQYSNILFNGNYGGWTGEPCNTVGGAVTPHISLYIDLLNDAGNNCPACTADYDNSGGAPNSSDFLAYLNDYQNQNPCADLSPAGGDGQWNSSDFLAFLNAYQLGC